MMAYHSTIFYDFVFSSVDCHLLAEFMGLQENDWKRANAIYKVNCEEYGYAKSCLQYGNSIFTGSFDKGHTPDPVEALKYFQKGCEIGSDENCLNSGLLLVSPKLQGSALPRDLPKVNLHRSNIYPNKPLIFPKSFNLFFIFRALSF